MNGTKKFYQSKVFYFALLFGAVQLAGLFGFADFKPTADVAELIGLVGAAVMLILRFVTNKGISL